MPCCAECSSPGYRATACSHFYRSCPIACSCLVGSASSSLLTKVSIWIKHCSPRHHYHCSPFIALCVQPHMCVPCKMPNHYCGCTGNHCTNHTNNSTAAHVHQILCALQRPSLLLWTRQQRSSHHFSGLKPRAHLLLAVWATAFLAPFMPKASVRRHV